MPAADAVQHQVQGEEEVLGGRRAEAVRERDLAPDRHPGAAQPDRDPSRSRPRGSVMPCSVNAASEASVASVAPRLLSLRAWTAGAPSASARSQAAKNPG